MSARADPLHPEGGVIQFPRFPDSPPKAKGGGVFNFQVPRFLGES